MLLSPAALLQEQWETLAVRLAQTQQQIRACETALVFAFVEVKVYLERLTLSHTHTLHIPIAHQPAVIVNRVCLYRGLWPKR